MVMHIDPDTGEEYEITAEEVLSLDNYYARLAKKQEEENLPAFATAKAVDGHTYQYRVIGKNPDGSLKTSQWDSIHLDESCACSDPERWY